MSQTNLYVPPSDLLGHIPELPKFTSRFVESDLMDLDDDDVDRRAIYLGLGLHHRGSIDTTKALSTDEPAEETLASSSKDPGHLGVNPLSMKRRSISEPVIQKSLKASKTNFFTVRDRGGKKRAVDKARRNSAPSLKSFASHKTDPLERWNSRKGRKWTSIRAKNRYEEIQKRLDEKKKEQRINTISKAMGKIISGVIGSKASGISPDDTVFDRDYTLPDVPLPVLTLSPTPKHRSIEDWLQQQRENDPVVPATPTSPVTPTLDYGRPDELVIMPKSEPYSTQQPVTIAPPPPTTKFSQARSLGRASLRGSLRGFLGLLRDTSQVQVQPQPQPQSQPLTKLQAPPLSKKQQKQQQKEQQKQQQQQQKQQKQQKKVEIAEHQPRKVKFASLRGVPSSPMPSSKKPLQPILHVSNDSQHTNVVPSKQSAYYHTPYPSQKPLSASNVGLNHKENHQYSTSTVQSKATAQKPVHVSRSQNPYLKRKNDQLYKSSAEAYAAINLKA